MRSIVVGKGLSELSCCMASNLGRLGMNVTLYIDNLVCGSDMYDTKKYDLCQLQENNNIIQDESSIDYLFIVAGIFLQKSITETSQDYIDIMYKAHFLGPLKVIQQLLRTNKKSFHIVVIGSCSSWKLRKYQSVYTAIRAAQSAFIRNLASEIDSDYPKSKVSLINLAGIKTPELTGLKLGRDEMFLSPNMVSQIVLDRVLKQTNVYHEFQIMRDKSLDSKANPIVIDGSIRPDVLPDTCSYPNSEVSQN